MGGLGGAGRAETVTSNNAGVGRREESGRRRSLRGDVEATGTPQAATGESGTA